MNGEEEKGHNLAVFQKMYTESLDVAFVVCSCTYANYGPRKFEDVFDQILPTAIVLQSAYWPFYKDSKGKCLCICEQYGIVCKHLAAPDSVHCLDMAVARNNKRDTFLFSSGKIKPLAYKITCLPTPANLPKGYLVSARIFIKGCDCPLSHKRRRQPLDYFIINSRYQFVSRLYPLPTKCTFMACPGLKTNADFVLQLRSMYNFPENILLGYKLEGEEFGKWTMRAATTVMVPRTYDKKSKKGKTCESC
ncbi:unnamed protein product [Tenebrio molitor]|nr:unnamed protein product [Tenebrio molitor]